MPSEAFAPQISETQKNWTLVATILGSSLVFINGSTVNVALATLQRQLGATVADIQWVVNAYLLFLAALILIGGSLGDRLGRRRIYVAGVALFGGASVWCGLAPTVEQLILARAVQGVGGALLTPGSLAILNATFEKKDRGRAIGLWSGFSALTSAIGPLLGGWLIDALSWRWIFFILVPMATIVILLSWWQVPESKDDAASGRLDWPGALLATLGLGGLTFGMISINSEQLSPALAWSSIPLGLLLLGLFLWRESRAAAPMLPLPLFRSATFSGANAVTFFLYAALGAVLFFVPLNLQQVQGYTATQTGAAFLPFVLLLSLLSRWIGGLANDVGARLLLTIGPVIVALGFLIMARPGRGGSYWTTFFPAFFAIGLGMAASVAPLTTTVMAAAPDRFSGAASGVNNAISRVANLFAIALFGIVILQFFSHSLSEGLAGNALSAEQQAQIQSEAENLAEIKIPAAFSPAEAQHTEAVIDRSFLSSFRKIMYLCAAMALGSSLLAWLTIDDRVVKE